MEVTLIQMLDAREARAGKQQALLAQFGRPLVCFSMNIAGPVKNSSLIRRGFRLGQRLLEGQFAAIRAKLLYSEAIDAVTGCEAIYVLDRPALELKAAAAAVEDGLPLGRLFDMDVIREDGSKVDRSELGLPPRTCLICGNSARGCARSRTHSVAQLQEKTTSLLTEALRDADARFAAELACRALLYEVAATPKPGLVDRANSGSHADMDFFTFQRSAAALWPYFETCARIGMETAHLDPCATFDRLRSPGRLAEGEMLRSTGGVNTHKGAIFSLGIVCAALGRLSRDLWSKPEWVLYESGLMCAGLVSKDYVNLTPETARTAGQKLYLQHGVTGVRGQAEAGFPAALKVGLPKLEEGLANGLDLNDAGCAALLAMMAATVDTNLIHRSSYERQQKLALDTALLLAQDPLPGKEALERLDRQFIEENLSPGGTADLLAMVYLLHFLKEEANV